MGSPKDKAAKYHGHGIGVWQETKGISSLTYAYHIGCFPQSFATQGLPELSPPLLVLNQQCLRHSRQPLASHRLQVFLQAFHGMTG